MVFLILLFRSPLPALGRVCANGALFTVRIYERLSRKQYDTTNTSQYAYRKYYSRVVLVLLVVVFINRLPT